MKRKRFTYVIDRQSSQHVCQASNVIELDVPNVDHTFNSINFDLKRDKTK